MLLLPFQLQVVMAWTLAKDAVGELAQRGRDDRGELTAGVIFLVALAVAAVGIAAIVVGKIQSQANSIP